MAIQKNAGFSFIELMIAIGVFAIVASSLAYLNLYVQKGQVRNASVFQLQVQPRNFASLVRHPKSWANTVNATANAQAMRCLKNRTPCTVNGQPNGAPLRSVAFALVDGSGDVVYNSADAARGFTLAGLPCATYSATGSSDCVLRYQLTWSAECTPGDCVDPQVKVEAPLVFNEAKLGFPLNPATYSLQPVYRAAQ